MWFRGEGLERGHENLRFQRLRSHRPPTIGGGLTKSERLRSRAELSEGRLHQANAPSFRPPFTVQADFGTLDFQDAAVRTEPRNHTPAARPSH